jgi:hypothetical protein
MGSGGAALAGLGRYAESEGFKADETRPDAWRYRDYVIDSFNSDKPYDRFNKEQLAGDELWPSDPAGVWRLDSIRHYRMNQRAESASAEAGDSE